MKTFLVICQWLSSPRVLAAVDKCPGAKEWMQIWPGAIIVKGDTDIKTISNHVHQQLPQEYVIAIEFTIPFTAFGWADPKIWEFAKNPSSNPLLDALRGAGS